MNSFNIINVKPSHAELYTKVAAAMPFSCCLREAGPKPSARLSLRSFRAASTVPTYSATSQVNEIVDDATLPDPTVIVDDFFSPFHNHAKSHIAAASGAIVVSIDHSRVRSLVS